MRELKFRAWSKKHNKYLKITGIQYDDDKFAGVFVIYGTIAGIPNTIFLEPEDVILEQSTGLKDKNGKKICVGDVVRFDNVDVEAEVGDPATVVYENGAFLAKCSDGNLYTFENGVPVVLGFVKPQLFKVIGNIHENPELLEGKE